MLHVLKRRNARKANAERLCRATSERARAPVFYAEFGVADSLDGRFDLVVLHAWLVLDAIVAAGDAALAQCLVDVLFVQFDEALRELGVGDMGMSRRMKNMAEAFNGRVAAYRSAARDETLAGAILRNVYRGTPGRLESAAQLANYCNKARAHLAQSHPEKGDADFGALP